MGTSPSGSVALSGAGPSVVLGVAPQQKQHIPHKVIFQPHPQSQQQQEQQQATPCFRQAPLSPAAPRYDSPIFCNRAVFPRNASTPMRHQSVQLGGTVQQVRGSMSAFVNSTELTSVLALRRQISEGHLLPLCRPTTPR